MWPIQRATEWGAIYFYCCTWCSWSFLLRQDWSEICIFLFDSGFLCDQRHFLVWDTKWTYILRSNSRKMHRCDVESLTSEPEPCLQDICCIICLCICVLCGCVCDSGTHSKKERFDPKPVYLLYVCVLWVNCEDQHEFILWSEDISAGPQNKKDVCVVVKN